AFQCKMYLGHVKVLLGMFLSLKTLYRKRTVIWPFYFYTIIRTLSFDGIELLLLKMLNYCDYLDNGDNASLSLSACLNFANWSCSTRKQEDSSYVDQLNILQVKYRLGSLSADENKIHIEVIESNISKNDEKFAVSFLLRNTALADKYFDLISEDIKEKIIKYPIYTLYKELK